MFVTSLSPTFEAPAVTGIYAGAETVLRFASVADELSALRHGCGVFDLGWRGKLVISGEDRVRWLNGMVTNNTRDLPQDRGNYSFVLDAKGHIQGDLIAVQRGDFYMLETEIEQIPQLREFFDRFIIMDDVEIGDVSSELTSLGVAGPKAEEVLRKAGLMAAELRPGQLADGSWNNRGYSLVRDPIAVRNWHEIWISPQNAEELWKALVSCGAMPVGAEALEWQRILLGLPKMGLDMGSRELPQETGQDYALHAAKGCYIGQEIVERVRSRGQVHRRLTGLILEGAAAEHGSKILAGDKEVGEVTSSAEIVVDGEPRTVALAYVRRNLLNEGEILQIEGTPVRLAELPFKF